MIGVTVVAEGNWPSFRGEQAAGVGDGPDLPEIMDAESGKGLLYKVRVPGLAHSSPIVWQDRLFLTTAVSKDADASFKPGLYGSGDASKDRSVHQWKILCLNKNDGELLWERTATQGKPIDKRHIKSTYANSTPCTDGKVVVAWFGSQGVFAYDLQGKLLWEHKMQRMDVGAYDLPSYEWGPASSPILYRGRVILQVDTQGKDYLIALDAKTGRTIWKTDREELPSWGTPTIVVTKDRTEVVTNGSNFIKAYDFETGKEIWRLGGSSKITAPTPVHAKEVTIVASGRAPESPIFAIRDGAKGHISLAKGQSSNASVAWRHNKRGPYMPSPLIYGDNVYILHNGGIFAAYDLKSGKEHFIRRVPHEGYGFSASPVASNGRIFLPGEDGILLEMQSGNEYEHVRTHKVGESLMASPAISEGIFFLRGRDHLFAFCKRSEDTTANE